MDEIYARHKPDLHFCVFVLPYGNAGAVGDYPDV